MLQTPPHGRDTDAGPTLRRTGEPIVVRVLRGGFVESLHRVHVVVARADGGIAMAAGDCGLATFLRSAAKPLQAIPLVEDGAVEAFDISDEELALCCASHSSQEEHVRVARGLLAKIGVGEEVLECRGHPPLSPAEAERLREAGVAPAPIHSNCSGKHAGMLALATFHGWPVEGYHLPEHPVQRRMLREVSRWTGVEAGAVGTGVDGCGVLSFRVPLRHLAGAMARFAAAAGRGEGAARVVAAMQRHPEMVAGRDRLCTALMKEAGGDFVAKTGAEGVYVLASPARGGGVALKAEDGARRASEVAAVAVASALGWIADDAELLAAWRRRSVVNTRGEEVGCIEVEVPWTEAS